MSLDGLEASELAAFGRKTYAMLGLSVGCGETALKKAFKAASLKYHPDKQHGKSVAEIDAASGMFLKVKEAYEVLSDEKKRKSLDGAILAAERATRANAERLERMDESRRRMRQDLERREAAAGVFQQKKAPVDAMRRANEQRAEDYARERARAARAAEQSANERTKQKADESARQRAEWLRKSVKVKWRSSRPATDDEIVEMVSKFGRVDSISRSSKTATIVFESEDAATNAAVDETLAARFKDVKLCTHDAFDRVRDAVQRLTATNDDDGGRAKATRLGAEIGLADLEKKRRAAERASLEAEIRASDEADGDARNPTEREDQPQDLRAKRRKLATYLETLLRNAERFPNDDVSEEMRELSKREFEVILRIVERAC